MPSLVADLSGLSKLGRIAEDEKKRKKLPNG
jgi:hypothetical protein